MKIFKLIADALGLNFLTTSSDKLSDEVLEHLLKVTDYNKIPDDLFTQNKRLYEMTDWNRISNLKLIRIALKKPEVLLKTDIDKRNFSIKEILPLIKVNPEYLDFFDLDLSAISKDETKKLLLIGCEEFIDKIDIDKYEFFFLDSFDIIKAYNYNPIILDKFLLKGLENFQVTDIIINIHKGEIGIIETLGYEFFSAKNWLEILEHKPYLFENEMVEIFKTSDIFTLIELAILFPEREEIYNTLINRDLEEISPFGWEKLLVNFPEKTESICKFDKLMASNWDLVLTYQPQFKKYKLDHD